MLSPLYHNNNTRTHTGTLLIPRERTADVYLRYASKYGVTLSEQEVLERFRW